MGSPPGDNPGSGAAAPAPALALPRQPVGDAGLAPSPPQVLLLLLLGVPAGRALLVACGAGRPTPCPGGLLCGAEGGPCLPPQPHFCCGAWVALASAPWLCRGHRHGPSHSPLPGCATPARGKQRWLALPRAEAATGRLRGAGIAPHLPGAGCARPHCGGLGSQPGRSRRCPRMNSATGPRFGKLGRAVAGGAESQGEGLFWLFPAGLQPSALWSRRAARSRRGAVTKQGSVVELLPTDGGRGEAAPLPLVPGACHRAVIHQPRLPGPSQAERHCCRLPAMPKCLSPFIGSSRANRLRIPGRTAQTARPALQTYCLYPACRLRSLPARPGVQPAQPFLPFRCHRCPGRGMAAPGHAGLSCGRLGPPRSPGWFGSPVWGGTCCSAASGGGWRQCQGSTSGSAARPTLGTVPNPSRLGDVHGQAAQAAPCLTAQHGLELLVPPVCHVLAASGARVALQGLGPTAVWGSRWCWGGRSSQRAAGAGYGPMEPPRWDAAPQAGRGVRSRAGSRQGFVLIQVPPDFSSPSPSSTAEREGAGRTGCQPVPVFGSRQLGSSPSAGTPAEPLLRTVRAT